MASNLSDHASSVFRVFFVNLIKWTQETKMNKKLISPIHCTDEFTRF